ncbi:MAG: DNA polymerase I [Chlamydiia bacterium]|nr:DNA polymerase I [Chlamydiia bacterium]MCH9623942.1 DNA polymerase I [Chlamydiia bacterium]
MKKIFIIDASNYIFRSYYAIRNMSNSKGVSTNALFGFIRAVKKIEKDFSPDYLAVVFDGPRNKASRISIYPDYKGNREKAPEDLYPQIAFAKKYCEAAGLPVIEVDGVEADDGMGAVARFAAKKGIASYLCSSDKDLCQLVNENTFIVHTHRENAILGKEAVKEKYAISPDQFIDYLAIVGDSSDNIPGIKGMGPKTAAKLLNEYGTLHKLLESAHLLKNKKQAEKIAEESGNAQMSYKLATIDTDLDIPGDLSFYTKADDDTSMLRAFYEKMEFKTLLKELGSKVKEDAEDVCYTLINDIRSLKGVVQSLLKEKSLCIDTETTGLNTMTAELVGIGLGAHQGVCYYIPLNGQMEKAVVITELMPLFSGSITFFGQNIKYDMHILKRAGLQINAVDFDTLIASYILESHLTKHGLDVLTEKHFGKEKIAFKSLLPKGKGMTFNDVPLEEAKNYCCEDVDYTIRLKKLFKDQIEEKGFHKLYYDIELPLLPILEKMEENGIYVDTKKLAEYSVELNTKIEILSKKIYEEAGAEFNINSPKQLSTILFDDLGIRDVKKHSTAADVLQALKDEHPIIPHIIHYRSLEKLRSTYVDALPKEVNEITHRIHCTFNQSGTVTGRLSSSSPNLQNIPIRTEEGRRVREAFVPEKDGWSFLSLDYSQIELRILAHMSGEKALIDAFNADKDIHTETAAGVYNVPVDQVTKDMRYNAKAVNFGILYGQSSFGLSKELGIEKKQAQQIIDTYFEKYPKVKLFIDTMMAKAKQEKKSVTLLGRERLLPDIDSKNFMLRAASERFAVNAPIQGSQSDIIKIAMIRIDKALTEAKMKSFLVLQIHDELIFECPEEELVKCENMVKEAMENAYSLLIPLKVDVSVGKNWGKC